MVQPVTRKYELLDAESIVECPICNELLRPPIYQCMNGHIVCAACREKLNPKVCALCRSKPVAHSRCLAVEKLMESLVSSCRHAPYGCRETLKLAQREEHETELCKYRPYSTATARKGAKKWAELTQEQQQDRLQDFLDCHFYRLEHCRQRSRQEQPAIDLGLQGQRQQQPGSSSQVAEASSSSSTSSQASETTTYYAGCSN